MGAFYTDFFKVVIRILNCKISGNLLDFPWVTKNRQYRKRTVCFYLRKKVYNEKKFRGVREYKKAAKG